MQIFLQKNSRGGNNISKKKKTYSHGLPTAIHITFQLCDFTLTINQLTFQQVLQLTEKKNVRKMDKSNVIKLDMVKLDQEAIQDKANTNLGTRELIDNPIHPSGTQNITKINDWNSKKTLHTHIESLSSGGPRTGN
jgi:hypothetical protein